MKNTATLGQIQKLLSLLEGIPSEQVQKAIESGFLPEIIRTGDLESIKRRNALNQFLEGWRLVFKIVNPEEIIITCPRSRCTYYSDDRANKFQFKVWKSQYGLWKKAGGHVSHGGMKPEDAVLMLEYYSNTNLSSSQCPSVDNQTLCTETLGVQYEDWHRETIEGTDVHGRHQQMDIITIRRSK